MVPLRGLHCATKGRLNMRPLGQRRRSTRTHHMKRLGMLIISIPNLNTRSIIRHLTRNNRDNDVTTLLHHLRVHMNVTQRFHISERPSHTILPQRLSNMLRTIHTTKRNNGITNMLTKNRSLLRGHTRLRLTRSTTNLSTKRRLLWTTRINNRVLRLTRALMSLLGLNASHLRQIISTLLRHILRFFLSYTTSLVRLFIIINTSHIRALRRHTTRAIRPNHVKILGVFRPHFRRHRLNRRNVIHNLLTNNPNSIGKFRPHHTNNNILTLILNRGNEGVPRHHHHYTNTLTLRNTRLLNRRINLTLRGQHRHTSGIVHHVGFLLQFIVFIRCLYRRRNRRSIPHRNRRRRRVRGPTRERLAKSTTTPHQSRPTPPRGVPSPDFYTPRDKH